MKPLLLVLALFPQDQSPGRIRELVASLASERVEVRDTAVRELKKLGKGALPELRKASGSPDKEVAALVSLLIRTIEIRDRIAPSLLRAFPGVEDRLAADAGEWTRLLFDAVDVDDEGLRRHRLSRAELDTIAADAVRGAGTPKELERVIHVAQMFNLKSTSGAVVARLKSPDAKIRRVALEGLRDVDAWEHAPEAAKHLADPEVGIAAYAATSLYPHPDVEPVALRLLDHENVNLRYRGLRLLGNLRSVKAVPRARKLLGDKDKEVRLNALRFLLKVEGKGAVGDLRRALRDFDPEVRGEALKGVESLGLTKAAPDLMWMLNDPRRFNRARAIKLLAWFEHSPVVPELVMRLSDKDMWSESAEALRFLADDSTLPAIRRHLKEGDSIERRAAAWAVWDDAPKAVIADLIPLLKDPSPNVRKQAVDTLRRLKASEAAGAIAELEKDPVGRVRLEVAKYFGGIEDRSQIPLLVRFLDDSYASTWSIEALKKLGGPDVAKAIAPRLEHQEASVRAWTLTYLRDLKAREFLPRIRERLRDEDREVRENAQEVVAHFATKESIPELIRWFRSSRGGTSFAIGDALVRLDAREAIPAFRKEALNTETSRRAIRWLALLRAREAVPDLRELLTSAKLDVAAAAAEALAWCGGEEAEKALLRALDDPRAGVRRSAAWGLSQLGCAEAIPRLVALLEEGDWMGHYRGGLCLALGELGDRKAVPALRAELRSPQCTVRGLAARSLGLLGAEEAIPALREMMKERPRCGHVWYAASIDEDIGTDAIGPVRFEAALSLARMGEQVEAEALFETGIMADFSALNRLRRPEEWNRLWNARRELKRPAGPREWEDLLAELGIRLEFDPKGLRREGALEILEDSLFGRLGRRMARDDGYAKDYDLNQILLEEGTVRVVGYREARSHWRRWLSQSGRDK